MNLFYFSVILVMFIVSNNGCTTLSIPSKKTVFIEKTKPLSEASSREIVTVWVHGTGRNPLIRKFHTSPKGLLRWANLPADYGLKDVGRALYEHDSREFHLDDFYTFGWSGQLSYEAREIAGGDLKSALLGLRAQHLKLYGKIPKVRVISHSHGCNVALNMADQIDVEETLEIEELILLACPVQEATKKMIESKRLKRIYSLYSTKDLTQILDPQGLYAEGKKHNAQLFSERRFPWQGNLVQAEIKWRGTGLTHAGFVRQRFGKALPNILSVLRGKLSETTIPEEEPDLVLDILG